MNKKVMFIIILLLIVVSLGIAATFMFKIEIDPFSYFTDPVVGDRNKVVVSENNNGFYRYRENVSKTVQVFGGCTLSYFDNYIIVINNDYYVYRSSCIGTFFVAQGKTKELKFYESLEKNKYITWKDNNYYKNNTIDTLILYNVAKDEDELGAINPEAYKIFLNEVEREGNYFRLENLGFKSSPLSNSFNLIPLDGGWFQFDIADLDDNVLYSVKVNDFDMLPNLKFYGNKLVINEMVATPEKYSYTFKVLASRKLEYDVEQKFPITVDDVVLTSSDSRYIKYDTTLNKYVMLVSKNNRDFCVDGSKSDDIAYYVFYIEYNYLDKGFDKPKFIEIVREKDGCKYVNQLMEG